MLRRNEIRWSSETSGHSQHFCVGEGIHTKYPANVVTLAVDTPQIGWVINVLYLNVVHHKSQDLTEPKMYVSFKSNKSCTEFVQIYFPLVEAVLEMLWIISFRCREWRKEGTVDWYSDFTYKSCFTVLGILNTFNLKRKKWRILLELDGGRVLLQTWSSGSSWIYIFIKASKEILLQFFVYRHSWKQLLYAQLIHLYTTQVEL